MTLEQLRLAAPAAFAKTPHSGVSDRYQFIPTAPLIERMCASGWSIYSAKQSNRVEDPTHSIHRVKMLPPSVASFDVGLLVPLIDITNSHNRACRLWINAGLLRKVCSNGLCIAIDGMQERLQRIHLIGANAVDDIDEAINHALEFVETLPAKIDRLANCALAPRAALEYARQAVALRFNEAPLFVNTYHPNFARVLEPLRSSDNCTNLWSAFNLVQEHLVSKGTLSRGRPLTAVKADRDFNVALWQLTQRYAEADFE